MAGSDIVFMADGDQRFAVSLAKAKSIVDNPHYSSEVSIMAATGKVEALTVPAGSYVWRVGLYARTAIAAADLNVGDGAATTRYLNGITTARAGDIIWSGQAGAVSGDMVGGHYYASEDTIDLIKIATGTTGSVRVVAWWGPLA